MEGGMHDTRDRSENVEPKKRRTVFKNKGRTIEVKPYSTDRFVFLDDTSLNLDWDPEPTEERES